MLAGNGFEVERSRRVHRPRPRRLALRRGAPAHAVNGHPSLEGKRAAITLLHLVVGVPTIVVYVAAQAARIRPAAPRVEARPPLTPLRPPAGLQSSTSATAHWPTARTDTGVETLVYLVYRINPAATSTTSSTARARRPLIGWLVPVRRVPVGGVALRPLRLLLRRRPARRARRWRIELPLLRLAGKGIVVYPYGGDARRPVGDARARPWHAYSDSRRAGGPRRGRRAPPARRSSAATPTSMLGCADLVEDLPRLDGVLLYPFDSGAGSRCREEDDGMVTVVHAPNHRHYKGTRFLEDAVAQLRTEGSRDRARARRGHANDEARRLTRAPTSSPTSSCSAPTRSSRSRRWRSASRCCASSTTASARSTPSGRNARS